MKGLFAKYIPAVFFFSLLFIFLNAIVSFYNLETLLQNEKLINHTEQVLVKVNAVHLSIKEAETTQRNYIITDEDSFLTSFVETSSTINKELSELLTLISDGPMQTEKVKLLQLTVDKRLGLLKKGIEIYQQNGFEAVQLYIKQGNGHALVSNINTIIQDIESTENELLTMRTNQSIGSANRTYTTILIETLCNIFLVFIIYYLMKRELDYRSNMEKRKDEFISIATHELKTPITSLQVFAQILQKKLQTTGDDQTKQYSERITKQVSRLTELINDLLDVSRLQLGKMKFEKAPFDMNQLVIEVVEGLKQTTDKHKIVIKGRIKKDVYGDEDRITQVMINLLSNAIKYSPCYYSCAGFWNRYF
jgi:CHASE3 domain sensor protein